MRPNQLTVARSIRGFCASALAFALGANVQAAAGSAKIDLSLRTSVSATPLLDRLTSPMLLSGDAHRAFRDPLLLHAEGKFWLFYSLATTDADGGSWWQTAYSTSADLAHWTEPVTITPRDRSLNFCSPGSVVRQGNEWVLALQTYPMPNREKFGNDSSRLWLMRSADLVTWGEPRLLKFMGPDVAREAMPRMIDPCVVPDKDVPGKWWCFCKIKQTGVSMAWSNDLETWHYEGRVDGGENAGVIVQLGEYVLFHSPENGVGAKRSRDLHHWTDAGVLILGQADWPWSQGRLTAGYVLNARDVPGVGRYLMVFHGEQDKTSFTHDASIGLAWSNDLQTWSWPGAPTK